MRTRRAGSSAGRGEAHGTAPGACQSPALLQSPPCAVDAFDSKSQTRSSLLENATLACLSQGAGFPLLPQGPPGALGPTFPTPLQLCGLRRGQPRQRERFGSLGTTSRPRARGCPETLRA